jgi:aminopeptidase N
VSRPGHPAARTGIALALVACAVLATAQPRFDFDATPGRLSKDVVPSHHALELTLDPARDHFAGRVAIAVQVRRPVEAIVVHAHELEARSSRLTRAGQTPRDLVVQPQPDTQTWRLVPADGAVIPSGEHQLMLEYGGKVQSSGHGLFHAAYGPSRPGERMLATQLASIHARELLPTFDEPAFRSAFEVTVRAPAGLQVLSNMPLAERRPDGPLEQHRFAPTPPMPVYLLAVSVGFYDVLEGEAAAVPVRIFTAPGKREQARYAMEVTQRVLPHYVEYFGVPYALPKLDQLAVPSTRDGAMEDWGLISYAEPTVLFDPTRSGPDRQQEAFDTISHEIAHMWFGNLVTHASWEEIWLNEAFATWIAGKLTDRFNPAWRIGLQRRRVAENVMARDSGNATRAIRSGPVNEAAVYEVLDNVTYVKGGAVLTMLEQWIGEDAFRRGLQAYMRERRLSNATAGDLWHHIGSASGRDIAGVAASWTDRPGLPLLSVRTTCRNGRTALHVSQQRFTTARDVPSAGLWHVPLAVSHGAKTHTFLLDTARAEMDLPGCATPVVNAGGLGYYRVDYAPSLRRELTARFVKLAPADQITLLSDRLALVQAGMAPASELFALFRQLPQAPDTSRAALFLMAVEALQFLDTATAGTPAQLRLRAAGRLLLAPELARLGWVPAQGEDAMAPALREALLVQLARFGDRAVIARATQAFDDDDTGRQPLPGSLRASVMRVAGMHADDARFRRLLDRLRSAGGEEERWQHALALSGARDPRRARDLLEVSLDRTLPPNIATALPGLVTAESPHARMAYDFTVSHWAALAGLSGTYFDADGWLLPGAGWSFNEADLARRLMEDQARLSPVRGGAAARRAAARIELLAAVREREGQALATALQGWRPGVARTSTPPALRDRPAPARPAAERPSRPPA